MRGQAPPTSTIMCSICKIELPSTEAYQKHIEEKHSQPAPFEVTEGGIAQPWETGTLSPSRPVPLTGRISLDDYAGTPFLTGSDVPLGTREIKVVIRKFVHVPNARTKLTVEIDEIFGCGLLGLNTTNIRALQGMGYQDGQQLCGKTLRLMVGSQPNPQQGNRLVPALFVVGVE
jgi:hypothetical protein